MKKISLICKSLFLSIAILSSATLPLYGNAAVLPTQSIGTAQALYEEAIYLHIDSPLVLSNGKISPLDPQNLDVAATIVNNRTLVPLRAVSEYFKAEVSYDSAAHNAIITFNGNRFIFPLGSDKYIKTDGKKQIQVTLDTKTSIINNRTMVPLKAICEDILGRKVSYYNSVIAIATNKISLQDNKSLMSDVKLKIGSALKARSQEQLKALINFQNASYTRAEVDSKASVSNSSGAETAQGSDSYSSTNIQVQGIDEADIVKTDGKYIYYAGRNAVHIVKVENGKMEDKAVIKLSNDKYVSEIYTDKDRLVIIGSLTSYHTMYDTKTTQQSEKAQAADRFIAPYYYNPLSFIEIYDISDHEKPVIVKTHEMEGAYQSSRKNGDIVYMITDKYFYNNGVVLPMMRDSVQSKAFVSIPLKDIMVMPDCKPSGYVIVSAMNITDKSKTQVEAITASGNSVYMSNNALYLTANNYDNQSTITKFQVNAMNIGYSGSGKVEGSILNQFSMDEYDGYLRVATTSIAGNNLFVLDNSLNVAGWVTGLAKGENIYSVRFIGSKGYVVTYRTMDPLFVFDLSDPKNPKVTGELKIPGFSNYLHPVGENLILGIGQDTYEIYKKDSLGNDVVIGARQGGIKLSLFDVSDMGKPKEISKYVLGDSGSYSEAFYNHKAVMVDAASGNVAFDATISEISGKSQRGAVVLNYSGNSIKLNGIADYIQKEWYSSQYTPYGCRVLYIGKVLYYVQDGVIGSYNYNTFEPIDNLSLK